MSVAHLLPRVLVLLLGLLFLVGARRYAPGLVARGWLRLLWTRVQVADQAEHPAVAVRDGADLVLVAHGAGRTSWRIEAEAVARLPAGTRHAHDGRWKETVWTVPALLPDGTLTDLRLGTRDWLAGAFEQLLRRPDEPARRRTLRRAALPSVGLALVVASLLLPAVAVQMSGLPPADAVDRHLALAGLAAAAVSTLSSAARARSVLRRPGVRLVPASSVPDTSYVGPSGRAALAARAGRRTTAAGRAIDLARVEGWATRRQLKEAERTLELRSGEPWWESLGRVVDTGALAGASLLVTLGGAVAADPPGVLGRLGVWALAPGLALLAYLTAGAGVALARRRRTLRRVRAGREGSPYVVWRVASGRWRLEVLDGERAVLAGELAEPVPPHGLVRLAEVGATRLQLSSRSVSLVRPLAALPDGLPDAERRTASA